MNKHRIPEYTKRINKFSVLLSITKKKHATISVLRLSTFIAFLLSWFWLFVKHQTIGALLGTTLVIVFLWLLKKHKKVDDKKFYLEKILELNENEKDCCNGDYSSFKSGDKFIDINHPYSYDIDLFGKGSLFQYLNRTITIPGEQLLAHRLSETPMEVEQIKDYQQAVNELTNEIDFRQEFETIGKLFKSVESETETIKKWLNLKPFFKRSLLVRMILYVVPLFNLIILLSVITGVLGLGQLALVIVLNLTIIASRLKEFNVYYNLLSRSHQNLKKMGRLFALIEQHDVKSKKLQKLKETLFKNKRSANAQIQRLTKFLDALDNRNNILIGVILNSLFLWDWQYVIRIGKWQKNHQIDFEQWLYCIANYDAIISLANLNYNNPDFNFPKLSNQKFEFSATGMGHPLLDSEIRICNEFTINSDQRFAIITGANMAGKSTFLRTIAVNLILAGAGASVCASNMSYTPLPMFSSMRTEDSLMKNESYFFAELKRLQRITKELEKGKKLFIILDEILRGTNSEDKRKGSIGFVKKITDKMAHGLVATHDLELARLAEQQPDVFKALCFEVSIESNKLNFDYKLQPGVTQNMNASFLMKQMGIIDE